MEHTLLVRVGFLVSNLEPIPTLWQGKATTALCYSPIIVTCIKHKTHTWIRKILHFTYNITIMIFFLDLLFLARTHLLLKPWTLAKGSAEPPILPLHHPTRRNSILSERDLNITTHQWPPLALHEPEPWRDPLPTQCLGSYSYWGVHAPIAC